jgi:hypothetical protein
MLQQEIATRRRRLDTLLAQRGWRKLGRVLARIHDQASNGLRGAQIVKRVALDPLV